jgi:hypothetical protein
MRAAHHRDRVLVGLRQLEQPARRVEHPGGERVRHVVADQIKETDLVRGLAKALPQGFRAGPQIHHGQRSDAPHVGHRRTISAGQEKKRRLPNRLVS